MQHYRAAVRLRKVIEQLLEEQGERDERVLPAGVVQLRGDPQGIQRGDIHPKDARDQQAAQVRDRKDQRELRGREGERKQ